MVMVIRYYFVICFIIPRWIFVFKRLNTVIFFVVSGKGYCQKNVFGNILILYDNEWIPFPSIEKNGKALTVVREFLISILLKFTYPSSLL
jgi:hypothetical protein